MVAACCYMYSNREALMMQIMTDFLEQSPLLHLDSLKQIEHEGMFCAMN